MIFILFVIVQLEKIIFRNFSNTHTHTHTHCIKFPLISFTILQPQPPLGRNDFGEREEKQPQSPPPQQRKRECHLHDAKQETL